MKGIVHGDSLKVLKKLEDDSVDMICTDPPYGYSFMAKDWDKAVPSVKIWKECLRVLKPGGFCFVMSAPRIDVQSQMAIRLEGAGFDVGFTPIYWTYATGFPKALNVGKAVDKKFGNKRKSTGKYIPPDGKPRNPSKHKPHKQAKVADHSYGLETGGMGTQTDIGESEYEGSYAGYQPKPAVEVVLVCMKPIDEKTYVEQALKNGKGVTWLGDCRIPYEENCRLEKGGSYVGNRTGSNAKSFYQQGNENIDYDEPLPKGRFAANLIVQDDVLNDGKVTKSTGGVNEGKLGNRVYGNYENKTIGSNAGGCGDEGSFSRYYDLDAWWESRIKQLPESVQKTFPFMIVPKASKSEKNKGLDKLPKKKSSSMPGRRLAEDMSNSKIDNDVTGRFVTEKQNFHPTVKPIELMSYLITLGSREGDLVVDPFVGSGTTCVAAKMLDRNYVGIEKEEDYALIAKTRVEDAESPNQPSEKNKSKDFFAF
tara:strand:+ start:8888 stop:10327 length:1440 start_codon:yes stop_codon:yes gene_type:complete